jgi:hypothetical protein
MSKDSKKPKKMIDKMIMGAVIGGAIGSVVGASIKKKKREAREREELKKKERPSFFKRVIGIFRRKKRPTENPMKDIPNEMEHQHKQQD